MRVEGENGGVEGWEVMGEGGDGRGEGREG